MAAKNIRKPSFTNIDLRTFGEMAFKDGHLQSGSTVAIFRIEMSAGTQQQLQQHGLIGVICRIEQGLVELAPIRNDASPE